VGSPVDRCFKLFLSIVLSTSRPLGVMSLYPQSVCIALSPEMNRHHRVL
jgi:hypothetical protein